MEDGGDEGSGGGDVRDCALREAFLLPRVDGAARVGVDARDERPQGWEEVCRDAEVGSEALEEADGDARGASAEVARVVSEEHPCELEQDGLGQADGGVGHVRDVVLHAESREDLAVGALGVWLGVGAGVGGRVALQPGVVGGVDGLGGEANRVIAEDAAEGVETIGRVWNSFTS